MLSLGRRELRGKAKKELMAIMKWLHEWNEENNKDELEKYIDICHIENTWMVHSSSSTGGNYFDYSIDDSELEEKEG